MPTHNQRSSLVSQCSMAVPNKLQTLPNNVIRSNTSTSRRGPVSASNRIHLHRMLNCKRAVDRSQPNHCQIKIINNRKMSIETRPSTECGANRSDRNEIADRNSNQQKAIRMNATERVKSAIECNGRICIDIRKMCCAFWLPLLILFSNFVSLAAAGKLKHFNCLIFGKRINYGCSLRFCNEKRKERETDAVPANGKMIKHIIKLTFVSRMKLISDAVRSIFRPIIISSNFIQNRLIKVTESVYRFSIIHCYFFVCPAPPTAQIQSLHFYFFSPPRISFIESRHRFANT